MASADLDTLNSTQIAGVQYLGLIAKALQNGIVSWQPVPATATSTGTAGQIAYNSTHLYICVSTNVWRRVAISAF